MRRSAHSSAVLVRHRRVQRSDGARRCFSRASGASEPAATSCTATAGSREVAGGASALAQQQLGFCCLLCGWDSACTACPFDWFGFDPRKFRRHGQRSAGGASGAAGGSNGLASRSELQEALATLGLPAADARSVSAQEVKAAFRVKALEWHPDCSAHECAEETFKDIVRAYELLLAVLLPP